MSTYTLNQMAAQASRGPKAALRDAAIAAGLTRYAVPLCGGGFTDHHRITSSGRCAECSVASKKRRKAGNATTVQEPLSPAVIEARKAAKSAARKARRESMTLEERTAKNRADRARKAANKRKGPRTIAS